MTMNITTNQKLRLNKQKTWMLSPVVSLFVFLLCLSFNINASPVDTYEFSDPVTQKRFNALNKELRCPKCLNQNLADSNSPIAADLRREVYELLAQGKADIEIMNYMLARYGDFVLYRPRVNNLTYILWFGPVVFILIGIVVVTFIIRRKSSRPEKADLSAEQKNKLNNILNE